MSTFDTPEAIKVIIDIGLGDIHLIASDRKTATVDIQPADPTSRQSVMSVEQIHTVFADNRLFIKEPRMIWHHIGIKKKPSVMIHVEVPTGSDITITTQMGKCVCEGRFGVCNIHTGMGLVQADSVQVLKVHSGFGDIFAGTVEKDASIHTGSGSINIGDVGGMLTIKNGDGNSLIGSVAGPASVRTGNGRVEIGSAPASASVKTANGAIKVGGILKGSSELKTSSGEIEIGISDKTHTWLDVFTFFGTVRNLIDPASANDSATEEARVNARTSYGDITITRS